MMAWYIDLIVFLFEINITLRALPVLLCNVLKEETFPLSFVYFEYSTSDIDVTVSFRMWHKLKLNSNKSSVSVKNIYLQLSDSLIASSFTKYASSFKKLFLSAVRVLNLY